MRAADDYAFLRPWWCEGSVRSLARALRVRTRDDKGGRARSSLKLPHSSQNRALRQAQGKLRVGHAPVCDADQAFIELD
jgi:hypothetical protein